jgi:hypothetical protein
MRTDLYTIAPYPKPGFRNEPVGQDAVTSRIKIRTRRVARLFIAWVGVFFVSVIFGVLGLPSVTVAGMALLFLLFLPMTFLLLNAPPPDCPQCGKRMKRDWGVLENARSGEFAILN